MGRVLVTGATGFLGRHLVSRLVERGEEVVLFVRKRPDSHTDPLRDLPAVTGDIRNRRAVEEAVEGAEVVLHLVSNFRSARTDAQAESINVHGTQNVLDACQRFGVRQLIHCSTVGVHGAVSEVPANEDSPFNPGDTYQETKLIAEHTVKDFSRRTGLPATVIRPMPMFGPGDRRMLKLFKMVDAGWFLRIGDGEVLFQPTYVDDVVRGFELCLRNPKALGQVFIIGGNEYLTLNRLVRLIGEELDAPYRTLRLPLRPTWAAAVLCERLCSIVGIEPPLHRRRLSFYLNDRAFSIDRARETLGYAPRIPLREGIRRTIQWYREEGWL